MCDCVDGLEQDGGRAGGRVYTRKDRKGVSDVDDEVLGRKRSRRWWEP